MKEEQEQQPPKGRRSTAVTAGVVAVAIVAIAGVLLSGGRFGEDLTTRWHNPPAGTPAATAAVDGPTHGAANGGEPPLHYRTVAGIRLPVSADLGPSDASRGLARGYARSHLGAVIAAGHIMARSQPHAGPRLFGPTIDRQVIDPKGDAFTRAVTNAYRQEKQRQHASEDAPLRPAVTGVVVGFRIEKVNPREPAGIRRLSGAVIGLLIQQPGERFVDLRLEVRWFGGDWRLYAPAQPTWSKAATPVADTDDYIPLWQ
ncbi:MAG: hypothetical protein ACRD0P_17970 [Stackebrandtia sp.]